MQRALPGPAADPPSVVAQIDQIDRVLPQTQCTQCGFAGCRPYARAIVLENAAINRCPPGGQAGIQRLAEVSGQAVLPLDPAYGIEQARQVARILPDLCIGCTLCIAACPVDAIAGAPKHLHAIVTEDCTGCRLCLAPCPVDCITMVAPPADQPAWGDAQAARARARHERRAQRLAPKAAPATQSLGTTTAAAPTQPNRKQALLAAALQGAQTRLARTPKPRAPGPTKG